MPSANVLILRELTICNQQIGGSIPAGGSALAKLPHTAAAKEFMTRGNPPARPAMGAWAAVAWTCSIQRQSATLHAHVSEGENVNPANPGIVKGCVREPSSSGARFVTIITNHGSA